MNFEGHTIQPITLGKKSTEIFNVTWHLRGLEVPWISKIWLLIMRQETYGFVT